jgi:hypothetical protein
MLKKWLTGFVLVALGLLQHTQAAYLLAMDESRQDFTLNVFDTTDGSLVQAYSTSLPNEVENVVYAGDNVAYGISAKADKVNGTLYKFILSDDGSGTVSYEGVESFKDLKDVDSIAMVGNSLYAINTNGKLYSIDLSDYSLDEIKLDDKASDVQALSYNSANGWLYGIDAEGGNDELFYIDLSSDSPTVTTVGLTGVNGIESLAFGDDGLLYAVSDEELYVLDVTTGLSVSSLDLGSWADDVEGLSRFSAGSGIVPEPSSVLAWLLIVPGVRYMVRRKRSAA